MGIPTLALCSALHSGFGVQCRVEARQDWRESVTKPLSFCRASLGLSPALPCPVLVLQESRECGGRRLGASQPSISSHSSLGWTGNPLYCDQNQTPRVPQTWVQILGSNQVLIPLSLD